MQLDNLGTVERKVLGALLIIADGNNDNIIKASLKDIANLIGYKASGGALTFAIKILERDNFLICTDRSTYKLLV